MEVLRRNRENVEQMDVSSGYSLCSEIKSHKVPAKFNDPSNITPPSSLAELVERLHEVFACDDICVEYVQRLMASYVSNRREWKPFAKWDPHRYTRNLVDLGNGKFNLMILCWNEAQGSSIHSHANSHCFMKVLDGSVKEELYEWPSDGTNVPVEGEEGDISDQEGMKKCDENVYTKNACAYINDDIGLHRVENSSHSDKAVSLHLYSPPFDECQCFDERTGRSTTSQVTFWSRFGKRTPFGRNPEQAPSSFVAENN